MTSLIKALKLLSMRLFVEKKPAAGTPTDTDKPNDGQTGDTTSPQTGDDSNVDLWIALMLVSACGISMATVYSRRKKYNH